MPYRTGWQRIVDALTTGEPPTHDPDSAYGPSCWYRFNERMGVKDPKPYPGKWRPVGPPPRRPL
jgi:hypothetical protein